MRRLVAACTVALLACGLAAAPAEAQRSTRKAAAGVASRSAARPAARVQRKGRGPTVADRISARGRARSAERAAARAAVARRQAEAETRRLAALRTAARARYGAATPSGVSNEAPALRDSVVAMARAQIGRRYVLGGTTPDGGFDCSGFVRYVLAALQINTPRTADEQAVVGRPVPRDMAQLRPGDLLTFGTPRRVSHIGIYVGDGKVVHASTMAGRIVEAPVARILNWRDRRWLGARRLLPAADSAELRDLAAGLALASLAPVAEPTVSRAPGAATARRPLLRPRSAKGRPTRQVTRRPSRAATRPAATTRGRKSRG